MLHVFAFLVLLFAIAAFALVVIVLGGLPGKIARQRSHPQAEAINVCGWVGLLTGVFWMIALVWAFTKVPVIAGPTSEKASLAEESTC